MHIKSLYYLLLTLQAVSHAVDPAVGAVDTDTTAVVANTDATTTPAAAAAAATTDTTTTPAAAAATTDTTTTPAAAAAAATTDTTTTPAAAAATTDTTTTPAAAAAAATTDTTTTPAAAAATTDTTTTPAAAAAAATTDTTGTTGTSSLSSESSSSSSSQASTSAEAIDPKKVSDSVVGTWSSKSNTVFTGPEFYDPIDELLIEPALPGISYSFTEDGYWEEAIYQVSANPKNHSCATAILMFQHGTYEKTDNGSLVLTPFKDDGRQLLSQPCSDDGISLYSRYYQPEKFKAYQVYVDPFHGKWRIDLIKSNGEYMQPLYQVYNPPQMLPTITLNPTSGSKETEVSNKVKRELGLELGLSDRIKRSLENRYKTNAIRKDSINYSLWWWTSASMMVLGGVIFIFA
ncbi:hypothetical protein CAS74_001159 [Pichia kudriavzevii]|uniref:Protein ROT1 n=1 Tax=Pichia kudriavzevii TaxID=4909 RepID=A0A1Z8JW68_PICKU|nr:hypothetical protein CAS74_001159 [Pichia kudriavzevii]